MRGSDWFQLILMLACILLVTKPLGVYFVHILDPEREGGPLLEKILAPIENLLYKIIGVDRRKDQNWKQYSVAMLIFSCLTMLVTYGLLRMQDKLPGQAFFNPQGLP